MMSFAFIFTQFLFTLVRHIFVDTTYCCVRQYRIIANVYDTKERKKETVLF